MKRLIAIFIVVAAVLCCSTSRASITNAWWWDDGDGALVCSATNWNAGTGVLSMSGDQYWAPGHMQGWINTDGLTDPTITLASGINNDSSFAWTAMTVNLYMSTNFTLNPVSLSSPLGDWTLASYTPVSSPTISPYGNYIATIVYQDGTPIPNDNVSELDFSYQLHFSGSPAYRFTQEMIPVPEPSTLVLVAIGGLLVARFTPRRGRQRG